MTEEERGTGQLAEMLQLGELLEVQAREQRSSLERGDAPHLQASQHPVLHHAEEFLVAETVVSVHVKQLEDGVQDVVRQVMACGDLHRSLELGWREKEEGQEWAKDEQTETVA